jgi:hypothetical protein
LFVSYVSDGRRKWFNICKQCQAAESLARYRRKQEETGRIPVVGKQEYKPYVEGDPEGFKTCRKCGKLYEASIQFFQPWKKTKDGLGSYCRSCVCKERNARHERVRVEVLEHYCGGELKCQCPGCTERHHEFLGIEHSGGGGAEHRRQAHSTNLYSWLKRHKYPEDYNGSRIQVMCFNCNLSRGFRGYCPHEREEGQLLHLVESLDESGG